jgi:hypothetical protein
MSGLNDVVEIFGTCSLVPRHSCFRIVWKNRPHASTPHVLRRPAKIVELRPADGYQAIVEAKFQTSSHEGSRTSNGAITQYFVVPGNEVVIDVDSSIAPLLSAHDYAK